MPQQWARHGGGPPPAGLDARAYDLWDRAQALSTITATRRRMDFLQNYRTRALAALRIPGAALRVAGEWETLDAILERRASLARYGDGELEIMIGGGIHFQE